MILKRQALRRQIRPSGTTAWSICPASARSPRMAQAGSRLISLCRILERPPGPESTTTPGYLVSMIQNSTVANSWLEGSDGIDGPRFDKLPIDRYPVVFDSHCGRQRVKRTAQGGMLHAPARYGLFSPVPRLVSKLIPRKGPGLSSRPVLFSVTAQRCRYRDPILGLDVTSACRGRTVQPGGFAGSAICFRPLHLSRLVKGDINISCFVVFDLAIMRSEVDSVDPFVCFASTH